MLDKKTLYVIYLLHKASNLCSGTPSLEEMRLHGYLSGSGRITRSLDVSSLVSILNEVSKIIDPILANAECKVEFPRTRRQFNHSYKLWLSSIHDTQM
ncbi:hypothetical protein [Bacteroides sp. 519]|uniref:hypothetical protein n=1 Tax=Bacteroides sp. 519 TaxID=2302937 RepID=UPI0013D21BA0|nr:hypothetical protein [Bacteroides sp. 519]NDV60776.1 hypothetical protein [Bacteroides sp. 519]